MVAPLAADAAERPFVRRVRMRARREVLWLEHQKRSSRGPDDSGPADSAIDPRDIELLRSDFLERDPESRELLSSLIEVDRLASAEPTWAQLTRDFDLSQPELDFLMAAVASEADQGTGDMFSFLQGPVAGLSPSPRLAAKLFDWAPGVELGQRSRLVYWALARPRLDHPEQWSAVTPWMPDPAIKAWVMHGEPVDPELGHSAEVLSTRSSERLLCLYESELETMGSFVSRLWDRRDGRRDAAEICLIGPSGSGKRTLAAQLCARLGADLLVVDAGFLLAGDAPLDRAIDRAARAARLARLAHVAVFWHDAEGVDPRVWEATAGQCLLAIFGLERPRRYRGQHGAPTLTVTLRGLSRSSRLALWSRLASGPPPEPVREWALTPGEISAAARAEPAGDAAVAEAFRHAIDTGAEDLVTELPRPYTWDDIVLNSTLEKHLREFEDQARLRNDVYEEWGFGRQLPNGRGVTALFSGPSGTGKTMSAQIIANSLHMAIYRVDLAGVVNKYIGETEKRLKRLFDACEHANVVLLWDEADALFGQRTQVKEAHDRFANIQIDYLLQRMERFDGVAILTTNRKADLDPAFIRRLRFMVDFVQPAAEERERLWRKVLPELGANGERIRGEIDWTMLAQRVPLSGADIKAAAVAAAFLARADGVPIGMEQVLWACRRELTKHGLEVHAGQWPR